MNGYCNVKDMEVFAEEIRVECLKEFQALGSGHIGGSMSVVETLAVLYGGVMNIDPKNPKYEDRDRFVLSKGHAGPALYATLALKGYFPKEQLLTLNKPGTNLPSHADMNRTVGIDMTTGSLGQGFSAAIGMALSSKIMKKDWRVYTIIGDGECNEGQIWEGALFAAHRKLDKLIAFVDWNKKQLDGGLEEISGGGSLAEKFKAFRWNVISINGHDIKAIYEAILEAQKVKDQPTAIILDTIKGHGCPQAEVLPNNHSVAFTKEQYEEIIRDAEQVLAEKRAGRDA